MSEFDAFTGGVELGGLRSKNDIRILVCYIMQSVNAPLSKADIESIMQANSLANYFEITDAISSLVSHKHITENENGELLITDTGREIANTLDATLPLSVRDKALEVALKMMAKSRNAKENKVDIAKENDGFKVTCHISGGTNDLMSISLFVPDKKQAEMVKSNFHDNPTRVYEILLAALTGSKDLEKEFFSNSN